MRCETIPLIGGGYRSSTGNQRLYMFANFRTAPSSFLFFGCSGEELRHTIWGTAFSFEVLVLIEKRSVQRHVFLRHLGYLGKQSSRPGYLAGAPQIHHQAHHGSLLGSENPPVPFLGRPRHRRVHALGEAWVR